ncbi:glucosaminidase domain-containing protein [uncultured Alistipes sp.]|jgi:hypothetical protein|uniref:glucosaminidase domain-containing protein n=1 Tax=uncultured Alistipes sp. TaxID=538949 RepID=UPI002610398D|nr:glucosaminidase domain-containing protein [uncultured Alistipes sp.]
MIIYKKAIRILVLFAAIPLCTAAQQITREEYIDRYKSIAVAHMERYGIPASITMAQGLLESNAGNSWLSRQSNNHFGIKCKRDWTGDRVYHDDDAKGECFRSYPTVEDSYDDHARFLDSQPRYDSLFAYSSTDYRSWARGLKAAGYATAPDYAERLVRIIEENRLYLLDRENGERLYAESRGIAAPLPDAPCTAPRVPEAAAECPIDPDAFGVTINGHCGYTVGMTNGVHHITARAGDTFESIGRNFRISASNLRRFNDLRGTAQPAAGDRIYIERKKRHWEGGTLLHTAREGETVRILAQRYGIRSRSIEKLNRLDRRTALTEGAQVKIR